MLNVIAPPQRRRPVVRDASLPITLIVVGAIGLIWYFRWLPDLDWIISLGFIAGGVLVLIIDRVNKSSIVTGPFLIAVGIAWWLRDTYRWSWNLIIPALLVILGVLMLIARSPRIPDKRSKTTNPQ
jgi:lipoprotein signal peptidase